MKKDESVSRVKIPTKYAIKGRLKAKTVETRLKYPSEHNKKVNDTKF